MQWRQIERWATIAIYVSAGAGLAVLLAETLAPAGSAAQQLAHIAANRLTRLGEIGGGLLFAVVLAYLTTMGGTWLMVLLMEGIERLKNRRARAELQLEKIREEIRKEGREAAREEGRKAGREEGREAGREEGREEIRAAVRERLEQLGIDPDVVLRPQSQETAPPEPHPANGAAGNNIGDERIRRIVRECLEQLGVNPDNPTQGPPLPPTQ